MCSASMSKDDGTKKASVLKWLCQPIEHVQRQDVLILFSGPQTFGNDSTTLKSAVRELSAKKTVGFPKGLDVHVHEYDYVNCGCTDDTNKPLPLCTEAKRSPCFNIMRDSVYEWLLSKCRTSFFVSVIAGIPCNSYCVSRLRRDGGAPTLRDREHPTGLPAAQLNERDRASLAMHNALTVRSLVLCAVAWENGAEVLIENPPDRGELGLWSSKPRTGERDASCYDRHPEFKRHAPLWLTPWWLAFMKATGSRYRNFAQCLFKSEFQKYTTLGITPIWLHDATELGAFDGRACECVGRHRKSAYGRNEDGSYVSAEAARYPYEMNRQIARAIISLAGKRLREPLTPEALAARVQAATPLWAVLHSVETLSACDASTAGNVYGEGGRQPTIRAMLHADGARPPKARARPPMPPCQPCAVEADQSEAPDVRPVGPCAVAACGVGTKRAREELGIPDDAPEDVQRLAAVDVPPERIGEFANSTLVGAEYGPRAGISDARHVLRALNHGKVGPDAGDLYDLAVRPLLSVIDL